MARVRITNQGRGLVTIGLNSGDSLMLAPGETSEPIEEYDTVNNPWVEKLVERGLATVESRAPARAPKPAKAKPAARRTRK